MSLAGVDLGTTGIKCAAFAVDGTLLASAYREYPLLKPQPDWAELDPEEVWRAALAVIKEVSSAVSHRDPVKALSISASGDEVVPVGRDGEVLHNLITSMDRRGLDICAWLSDRISVERLYEITGLPLHPMYGLNRILWLKRHKPEVFDRTRLFLSWPDFILSRLGAEVVTDYSSASRLMAFDIRRKSWSTEILSAAEIDPSLFPPAVPSGTAVGKVSHGLARELGLRDDVVLVTGGFDQACSSLGAGATGKGIASVTTGTVETLCIVCERPASTVRLLKSGFPFDNHVLKDRYICLGSSFGAGSTLRWFRDTFGQAEVETAQRLGKDAYDLLLQDVPLVPARVLFLPHLPGAGCPWKDPRSKGAILGLTLATSRAEVIKALLDGTTYELRQNLEIVEAETDERVEMLRAVGGGAKSAKWLQLKADITGRIVERPLVTEAGCLAAAILAGVGSGVYEDARSAAENLVRISQRFEPNRRLADQYEERYSLYREIYPLLKDFLHRL